jgi:hypothetical protein
MKFQRLLAVLAGLSICGVAVSQTVDSASLAPGFAAVTVTNTPQSLVQAYFAALSTGKHTALTPLFPDYTQHCRTNTGAGILEKNARYLNVATELQKRLQAHQIKWQLVTMGRVKKREQFAAGALLKDCVLTTPAELLKVRVDWRSSPIPSKNGLDGDAKLIRLGDQWYMRKPLKD